MIISGVCPQAAPHLPSTDNTIIPSPGSHLPGISLLLIKLNLSLSLPLPARLMFSNTRLEGGGIFGEFGNAENRPHFLQLGGVVTLRMHEKNIFCINLQNFFYTSWRRPGDPGYLQDGNPVLSLVSRPEPEPGPEWPHTLILSRY